MTLQLKSHKLNCAQRHSGECTCGAFEHNERVYAQAAVERAKGYTRYVKANNNRGRWSVYEESASGDCWLADFESESMAYELAAVPDLLSAAKDALESLRRLEDRDGAYRVTNISQLQAAIRKAEGAE